MKKNVVATRGSDQINLRLPEGMRERLNKEAALQGRSTNTEIILRLERSLDESDASTIDALREYLQEEFADIRRELAKTREMILKK